MEDEDIGESIEISVDSVDPRKLHISHVVVLSPSNTVRQSIRISRKLAWDLHEKLNVILTDGEE